MGFGSDSGSQNERDEDEEEEYDEVGGGNRFLGFMFGNVDNSGDLDVDYLDEDAKEHLAALADKLGPSLTDIDLSVKSPHTSTDVAEQGDVIMMRKLKMQLIMKILRSSTRDQRFKLLVKRTICCQKMNIFLPVFHCLL